MKKIIGIAFAVLLFGILIISCKEPEPETSGVDHQYVRHAKVLEQTMSDEEIPQTMYKVIKLEYHHGFIYKYDYEDISANKFVDTPVVGEIYFFDMEDCLHKCPEGTSAHENDHMNREHKFIVTKYDESDDVTEVKVYNCTCDNTKGRYKHSNFSSEPFCTIDGDDTEFKIDGGSIYYQHSTSYYVESLNDLGKNYHGMYIIKDDDGNWIECPECKYYIFLLDRTCRECDFYTSDDERADGIYFGETTWQEICDQGVHFFKGNTKWNIKAKPESEDGYVLYSSNIDSEIMYNDNGTYVTISETLINEYNYGCNE